MVKIVLLFSTMAALVEAQRSPVTFDTHQIVFGPGAVSVNKSSLGVGAAPDQHSRVFAPGTLGGNKEYLFFVSTAKGGNFGVGATVLSGGSGSNKNGQWTLEFPRAEGYGSYASGFGQLFNTNVSLAIATSLDYGKTWPTCRGTPTFNFVAMPGVNQAQAPNAPMGASGKNVCMGNDCTTPPPVAYGRYPVVTGPTSLASLMGAAVPLTSKYGEQEISAFVDDLAGNSKPYIYANSGDVRVARAQLNGGTAPSFVSLGKSAGHLSLTEHVFYLFRCQGGGTPGVRQMSSRAFTITTAPASSPVISKVANAEGESLTIAPNTWVEIKGRNLAPAGDSRIWQGSEFVGNRMPTQLDKVSVTVNGKNAYVYYISPTQVNVLTPPDALSGTRQVVFTNNGVASAGFTAQAEPISPSFFVFDGGPYVAATHAGLVSPGEFPFNVVVSGNTPDGEQPITATYNGSSTQTGTLTAIQP